MKNVNKKELEDIIFPLSFRIRLKLKPLKLKNKGKLMEAQIRNVMKRLAESHRDNLTGEMDYTGLAEEACCELDAYDGDDIPEEFFEIATEFN